MSTVELTRKYLDAGVEVAVTVPETWLEFEIPGALWCLGEPVEVGVAPNLTLTLDVATPSVSVAEMVRSTVAGLADSAVYLDEEGVRDGRPSVAMGYSFRDAEGTPMVQFLLAVVVEADPSVVVTVVGTCGAGVDDEVASAVSDAVSSLVVATL